MRELPPDIRRLLQSARRGLSSTGAQREATQRRLVAEFWSKPVSDARAPRSGCLVPWLNSSGFDVTSLPGHDHSCATMVVVWHHECPSERVTAVRRWRLHVKFLARLITS